MIISWLGEAGIRLQTKETVVLIDPPAASTGLKPTRQTAQIVALTETDGRDAKSVGGEPFMITSPGEYERQNVFVYGIQLPNDSGRTHFRIEAEELSIGHLGSIEGTLENEQIAQFEGVDILFVPVGGKSVVDAEAAVKLVSQIEPRIVIPIQYKFQGSTAVYADVASFLKELGGKGSEPTEKYKIVKKDLPADETQVVVLTLSHGA